MQNDSKEVWGFIKSATARLNQLDVSLSVIKKEGMPFHIWETQRNCIGCHVNYEGFLLATEVHFGEYSKSKLHEKHGSAFEVYRQARAPHGIFARIQVIEKLEGRPRKGEKGHLLEQACELCRKAPWFGQLDDTCRNEKTPYDKPNHRVSWPLKNAGLGGQLNTDIITDFSKLWLANFVYAITSKALFSTDRARDTHSPISI